MMKPIEKILAEYENAGQSSIIPILQKIQESEGYLSETSLVQVSTLLNMPINKIYGVSTFYNQFRFVKPGFYQISVCRGTACHVKNSMDVLNTLCRELDIKPGETSDDGLFSLEVVACIGACGLAPVICISGDYHAGVDPRQIRKILSQYRKAYKKLMAEEPIEA